MNTENNINFRYIAINSDGKKVAGQISVVNEAIAREELHKLGLSVLSISKSEAKGDHVKEGLAVFEFEGTDKSGKFVKGTIEGSSALPIYRRLTEEYKFQVQYLAPVDGTAEEKQTARRIGVSSLESEYKKMKGNSVSEAGETAEKEDAERKQLLTEVDAISKQADEFIAEYFSKISGDTRSKLSDTVKNLRTIRNSNNLRNVKITKDNLAKLMKEARVEIEERDLTDDRSDTVNRKEVEQKQDDEERHDYEKRLKGIYEESDSKDLASGIRNDVKNVITMKDAGDAYTRLRVKTKIYLAKKKIERTQNAEKNLHKRHWLWVELHRFTGLLLFFYLLYFITGGLLATKDLGLGIGETVSSTLGHVALQQIMLFVFIFYCVGQIYEFYFRRAGVMAVMGLALMGFISYVFLAVNL